jgi:hypothetical protein
MVQDFVEGHHYTRDYIGSVVGGDTQRIYLPKKKGGPITCAILNKKRNLVPPDIILVGEKERNRDRAEQLCKELGPIPVFVGEGTPENQYCGQYEVSHWTEDSDALARWGAVSNRTNVTRVIFMKKVEAN